MSAELLCLGHEFFDCFLISSHRNDDSRLPEGNTELLWKADLTLNSR